MKKNLLLWVFLILFGVNGFSQQKKAKISFVKESYQLGTIKEINGAVECTFEFTNIGGEALKISKVKGDYGLTITQWPKEDIVPGGKGTIKAKYNPQRASGRINKKITVVIPALNEWKVIRYALSRLFEAFKKYNLNWECIVMDSSDDWLITKKEAEKLWAKVISIPKQWLWKAYIDSLKYINGELDKLYCDFNFNLDLINNYIDQVKRLKFSYRWNRLNRLYKISVLSHLYVVFWIGYFLWRFENLSDNDFLELLLRCIFHDIPEALTGDIVSPTKKAVKWLEELINNIEEDLVKNKLLVNFEDNLAKKLAVYMLSPFEGKLWKLVKFADLLSAMWEARLEKDMYFEKVYQSLKRKLMKENRKSLKYILDFWDEYFLDDVEQIWNGFLKTKKIEIW